ncbi:MAG: MgtC/SapB family protein, partial [Clostridia bacterium]|nr:MgtC/SapB family protein [Clostridia bacterium]
MFELQHIEYILRILLAGICGMLVGVERKRRSKEAGTRTHFVVACGAALMMVISKYAFFDLITDAAFAGADVRLDPSRVASTIASGIGFLGAG